LEIYISYIFAVLGLAYFYWFAYRIELTEVSKRKISNRILKLYFLNHKESRNSIGKKSFIFQSVLHFIFVVLTISLIIIQIMKWTGHNVSDISFIFLVIMFSICALSAILAISDMIVEFYKEVKNDIKNKD